MSTTAAEQVTVVVATELTTEKVQSQRVDARVDERQTERDDLKDVPEHVVLGWVEEKPEREDVTWQPADNEDDDEGQDQTSHFLASFHLQRTTKQNCSNINNVSSPGQRSS